VENKVTKEAELKRRDRNPGVFNEVIAFTAKETMEDRAFCSEGGWGLPDR